LFQSVHRHPEIHARFADREGDGDRRATGTSDLGAGPPGAGDLLLRPVREVSLSARTIANSGQRPRLADQQLDHVQHHGGIHRLAYFRNDPHRCRAVDCQDVFQRAPDSPVAGEDGNDAAGER